MHPIPLPAVERLRSLLSYDPETGRLTWLISQSNRAPAGSEAGSVCSRTQYRIVGIDGRLYRAHRLIWKMMKGEEPPPEIDHRDLDASNNCWANLRAATHSQNGCNKAKPSTNTSGFKGVYLDRWSGRWKAQIKVEGLRRHIGRYDTREEAAEAYRAKARELHGEFARHD